MATTVSGGAYLNQDKKTWHDANGNPIKEPRLTKGGKVDAGQQVEAAQATPPPADPKAGQAQAQAKPTQ